MKAIAQSILLSLMTVLTFSGSASAQKKIFACLEDKATGFIYKDRGYQPTPYAPSKFTVSIEDEELRLTGTDGKTELYNCSVPYIKEPYLLQCVQRSYFIMFDMKRNRFSRALIFGHIFDSTDALAVSYGGCQPF